MQTSEFAALAGRIEELERQARLLAEENRALAGRLEREVRMSWGWRLALVFLVVAGALTPLVARLGFAGVRDDVSARQFTLRDGEGRARASLLMDPQHSFPVLAFYDRDGINALQVGAGNDGSAGLNVLDRDGVVRLSVGGFKNGSKGVNLYGADRNQVASFGADDAGTSAMNMFDRNGMKHVSIGVRPDGSSGATVVEKDGKIAFTTLRP